MSRTASSSPSAPTPAASSSHTSAEIASQPECWRRAAALAPTVAGLLPATGERVAVVGCGTSWFIAQAYAALREHGGGGETDAFTATAFPRARTYDRVLAITRSGTTTEVLDLLRLLRGTVPTTVVTGDADTPAPGAADHTVLLDFADERSVVQTRFATTTLALLRADLEHRGTLPAGVATVTEAAGHAEAALAQPLDHALTSAGQFTFLGTGWTYGLAQEAALKMREAAGAWTEAYPAMEYRHGPISIAQPGRAVWALGALPEGLADDITRTGATLAAHAPATDPLADLVRAQRLAVHIAEAAGHNPDTPRNLTRSVVLTAPGN
ncbi:SIS domain-containing protein [Streptomyces genisteinicus]|uniref:Sugar isomerase n=1 Tax=Streptomyces genisteinicus TaxID=2768068 RepID=A0A7H0I1X4_9ACTN|nr:SIS domain-containing protein [Streptomyces genisteinicus]QNP66790.1 sugar isomerase [Streptomyces genisteinicus]